MNIFILLTPFHIKQLNLVINQYNIDLNNSIFLSPSDISELEIKNTLNIKSINHFQIPQQELFLKQILKNPFKEIKRARDIIENYKHFISKKIHNILEHNLTIFIGSEKHIFTQILINYMSKNNLKFDISALEEGLGYYINPNIKSKITSLLYPIITPILFKESLNYVSQMGTHKLISKVYARFPEQIMNKRKNITYLKIKQQFKESNNNSDNNNLNILFFTSPLSEYKICSKEFEQKVLYQISSCFNSNKLNLSIKPHPAEKVSKYKIFNTNYTKILNKEIVGESVDYSNYTHFIHFGSSIILDLYSNGISLKNIITIDPNFFNSKLTNYLYSKGKKIDFYDDSLSEKLNILLEEIKK